MYVCVYACIRLQIFYILVFLYVYWLYIYVLGRALSEFIKAKSNMEQLSHTEKKGIWNIVGPLVTL